LRVIQGAAIEHAAQIMQSVGVMSCAGFNDDAICIIKLARVVGKDKEAGTGCGNVWMQAGRPVQACLP
jgi:hypothetical protein